MEYRGKSIYFVRRPFSNIHEKVIHIDRGRDGSLARSLPSAKTSLGLAKHRWVGEGRAACWQVAKELLEAEGNYHTVNKPSSLPLLLSRRSRGFVLRMSGGCQFRPGRVCDAWEDERERADGGRDPP